ncbi:MAG: SDR family oxidoreductase [Pseudomonadota bacterium]
MSGKIALVTGAASGIGAATLTLFQEIGATAVGADLKPTGDCLAVDVADAASVAALFDLIAERHGRLDILVCAAATTCRHNFAETTLDDWNRVLAVNLTGTFLCCRAAIPLMKGGGSIVTIGSDVAERAAPNLAAYSVTKGAMVQLAKAIALDHGADGIRANCVAPGPTDTPLIRSQYASAAEVEAAEARGADLTLLGRLAGPEEVARTIAFVASDEASFMTGALVPVDGGATVG